MRFDTRAVRSGRGGPAVPGVQERGTPHVPGIDLSTTYGFRTSSAVADSMDALLEGDFLAANPVYARLHNPTVAGFEQALAEVAMEEKVGLLAYSPIAQGSLSGKYLGGQKPKGSRGEMFGRLDRYKTPNAEAAIAAYVEVARDMGVHPAALAMQFVTTRPFVTSNIFGANGDEQLDVIFNSLEVELTAEVMQRIADIHKRYTNPCP